MMKTFSTIFTLVLLITLTATLSAQVNWTKDPNNPVFTPGSSGEWDDYCLWQACILFDDTTYHMWYGGHDGTTTRIGYATSPDGITWERYAENPVLEGGSPGSWEDNGIGSPYVIFDGNTYHMWYGARDGTYTRIGYATSTDRVTWTKYEGNPVLDRGTVGSWDEMAVYDPCIKFDGSTYHMWYDGWSASDTGSIGYATSSDGISWTPYAGNPVLTPDPGYWESRRVESPEVFFDGSVYHMWYSGYTTTQRWHWQIGYASSDDGILWKKYDENPILRPSAGSWDSQYVGYCKVIWDTASSQYKMWYGGGNSDWDVKIGYATIPTRIYDELSAALPGNFVLMQNYPNPFNPNTVISWQLAVGSNVKLSIYNVLGQKIETLINKPMPAGYHEVEFNGQNLSSGVYLYRIKAGAWRDVKKMVLLR